MRKSWSSGLISYAIAGVGSLLLSVSLYAEVPRFQADHDELDARPLQHFNNIELADYLRWRARIRQETTEQSDAPNEMGWWAKRSLGQAFRLNAVQFDLAESDCVSFVNRTLALSLASDWPSYYALTERLRHKDGIIKYQNRNFATLADWLPNNAWLLQDVTAELGSPDNKPSRTFTHMVRPKLFEERPAAPGSKYVRVVFKGSDYRSDLKEIRTETYVPMSCVPAILPELQTGDVVLILRQSSNDHLSCDHMGMIVCSPTDVTFVHSVPHAVRQETIQAFSTRCHWVTGLKFLRLRGNALELAKQEAQRLRTTSLIPEPAEQDQKVSALRARRAQPGTN